MCPTLSQSGKSKSACARVLVVEDEPELLEVISHAVSRIPNCTLFPAGNLGEARKILERETIELMVTDLRLPDGDGTSLLGMLKRRQPNAAAILMSGAATVEGAITALRGGAVDFILKPFAASDLAERVQTALKEQAAAVKDKHRVGKLRKAVRRLNEARKTVTKKVDLLCNDLIGAYGELSRQLDIVRVQEGFKHFLSDSHDLEQLLCHTMDYLMRQLGYSNIAIFLAGDELGPDGQPKHPHEDEDEDRDDAGETAGGRIPFQLGAYMKYTMAAERELTGALGDGLVQSAVKEGIIHIAGDEMRRKLTSEERVYLEDQDVLAVNCTYLGEALAAIVMFRDMDQPYLDADIACLKTISPLFAVALASVVHGEPPDGKHPNQGGGPNGRDEDEWWKTGQSPPF